MSTGSEWDDFVLARRKEIAGILNFWLPGDGDLLARSNATDRLLSMVLAAHSGHGMSNVVRASIDNLLRSKP